MVTGAIGKIGEIVLRSVALAYVFAEGHAIAHRK